MNYEASVPEPWPPHSIETRPWTTNPDARDSGGRRPSRDDRLLSTVEVSIPPRIRDLTPALSSETAVAVDEASASIARLDEVGRSQLGALGGFLLRSESVATSKIERISADLDDFARALVGHRAGSAARQMAAAAAAIGGLVDDATDDITMDAINRAQRKLLEHDPLEREGAGAPRAQQNWLGGSDFSPLRAIYVPPPPDLVSGLMNDLVAFASRQNMSPVVQSAIVHAQFESIHPYTDGNGRIGRALINAVLRRRALTSRVVVPVASAMLANVDKYFAQLNAYQAGNADEFVRGLAEAAVDAASEAQGSARTLEQLPIEWRERIKVRRGSTADRLLDRLLETPVLTDKSVAATTGSSIRRAYDALDALTDAEILTEITGQSRNRVWIVGEVLDEIDRLEIRIGRRAKPSAF